MGETRVALRDGTRRGRPWARKALETAGYQALWLGLFVPILVWFAEGDARYLLSPLLVGLGGFAGAALRQVVHERRKHQARGLRVTQDWLVWTELDGAEHHIHRRQVTHAVETAVGIELRDGWEDVIIALPVTEQPAELTAALAEHGWPVPARPEA